MALLHRLLVTGGAGFIGSNYIRQQLLETKETGTPVIQIVCLDKITYAGNLANFTGLQQRPDFLFIRGDINEPSRISSLLNEHRITGIIHFAAETHVDRSIDSPEAFIQNNVLGTVRLLEAARHYWNGLSAIEKSAFLNSLETTTLAGLSWSPFRVWDGLPQSTNTAC